MTFRSSTWLGKTILGLALLAIGLAFLPPLFSMGRDLWFIQRADSQFAHGVLSEQLRLAADSFDDRQQDSLTLYSSNDPLLFCPEQTDAAMDETLDGDSSEADWTPEKGGDLILLALLNFRQDATEDFQTEVIAEHYSTFEIVVLKACISSSIFSTMCRSPLQEVIAVDADAYDQHYKNSVASHETMRETYCRYLPGAIEYQRSQRDARE